MKAFRGFVVKELYHILRDWRTLMILLGMPVIMMGLFGFAIRNEVNDVKAAIVDLSRDATTREIANRLEASGYFRPLAGEVSMRELDGIFQRGEARIAVVFQPEFERRLVKEGHAEIQLVTDATEPNMASTVLSYATAIIQRYQQESLAARSPGGIVLSEVRMRFNPALKSAFLFVPGLVALILMLVCALMTSITITREKEVGTMEVLLVSPLRPPQIVVGKVMPYMVLSVVNVFTVLTLARLVFKVPVRGSLVFLLLECLLFIVCALSLGILISSRTNSQQTAMMISLAGLLLPTVLLSGFIFPISSMPLPLRLLSHVVPARWFLVIIRGIMIKGIGIAHVWQETLILSGMTLFFIAAAVRSFKIRLE